ncbi:hypothetical protein ACQEU3_39020 [Spirillospora sp. CA-253888]
MGSDGSGRFDVEKMGWELLWFGSDEWLGLGDCPIEARHWPTLIKVLSCPPPEPHHLYFLSAFSAGS